MSNIPDDIMKAANECVAEFRWNNDNQWHLFVAKALLAERERCAKVADWYSDSSLHAGWTEDACGAGYYACADVAEVIRNPKPTPTPSQLIADGDIPF